MKNILIPYKEGIKFTDEIFSSNTLIDTLMPLPFCVYFSDTQGIIQYTNNMNAQYCGFYSYEEAIGKTLNTVFTPKTADIIRENDINVMREERSLILEESGFRQNGMPIHALVVKLPWYDMANTIKGIFGCAIISNEITSIANFLTIIKEWGLLNKPKIANNQPEYFIASVKFSKREYECLYYTVRGKSAKQIAFHLKISTRTVEEHLINIKNKLNVYSKNELIDKTIDWFF